MADIKRSKERVKKTAEIFTPPELVEQMLDALQKENPDCYEPGETFLEPSCGEGAFCTAILARKLRNCASREDALTALGSICGVEIMPDNVEVCRREMARTFELYWPGGLDVGAILRKNIVCGDFLTGLTREGEQIWFLDPTQEQEKRRRYLRKKAEKTGKEPLGYYKTKAELCEESHLAAHEAAATGYVAKCGIDIETRSRADLTKTGVHRYVEDPDFRVMIVGYRYHGEYRQLDTHAVEDPTTAPELEELRRILMDDRIRKTAFNAPFERTCLSRWLGVPMPPEAWECTMVKALTLGLPGSLEDVGLALGLPEEQLKDPKGKALIRFFSQPAPDGSFRRPEDYPDKWAEYLAYNRQDVVTEQSISERLEKYETTEEERKLWILDQQQNDRGIRVDLDLAAKIVTYDEARKGELMAESRALTGLDNPGSLQKLKAWCASEGYPMASITKESMDAALADPTTPSRVRRALEIRAATGKASVAKYAAMLSAACKDGRLRGILQFYGANRSGRWAGRIVQTHNLAKNSIPDIGLARELAKAGRFDELDTLFGEPAFVFSELVRTAFIPSEGRLFAVSDFSAIEARVLAWLSGERWVLDAFRGGKDIYCETASAMYHVPVGKHGPNAELRAKGKVAVLACGYQGGVGAMRRMDRGGKIPEDELQQAVDQWRSANRHTVALWRDAEKAAKDAIRRHGTARLGRGIEMEYTDGILFIRLPSGRRLAYWDAQISRDTGNGREQITYAGTNPETHRWERAETYGGKLVENITQAVARDCLADAMRRVAAMGYEVAMHIHDEMVVDVPAPNGREDAERALAEVNEVMSVPPAWAEDLPLQGAGYVTPYYIKD